MISALNGSSRAGSLITLFARPAHQVSETPVELASAAQRLPPPPPPPPSAGLGYSAQALYSALLGALLGALNEDGAAAATPARDRTATTPATRPAPGAETSDDLSRVATRRMGVLDADGDGTLATAEVKSAVDQAAKAFSSPGTPPQGMRDAMTRGSSATSLYQSLVEAMAADQSTSEPAIPNTVLAQKFVAMLQQAAWPRYLPAPNAL